MTTRKRRIFDISLKLEVIRMIKEQGQSVPNVSETMSIGQTAIRRWLTQYSAEQNGQPGISYASALYQDMLARHGFVCSMSRKGNCWDTPWPNVSS